MTEENYPISKQLGSLKTTSHFITIASWDTGYGPSYEIGIRNTQTKEFTLIQPYNAESEKTIHRIGDLIKVAIENGFNAKELQALL